MNRISSIAAIQSSYVLACCWLAVLCLGSASASTTIPVFSQDAYSIGQGDLEVNFALEPRIFRGPGNAEAVLFRAGGNYFLTDMLAPGLDMEYNYNGASSFLLFPNIKAYWQTGSRFLPYMQAGAGLARQVGQWGFDIGFGPGVNYLLSPAVAIGFQMRYDIQLGSAVVHTIQFPLAFHIFFRI